MLFVTGASGFIGKHFVKKALSEEQELIVLTRNAGSYKKIGSEIVIEGNLSEWESWYPQLEKYNITTCVHLAWEGIPDYLYDCSERNLQNGLSVLRICDRAGINNLVITGSCWEYKNPRGCISTSHELDYSNAFKAAKQSIHMMASAFCKERGIHLNWLRIFYAYGPGQREGSLIPYIIKSFSNGMNPQLNGIGNSNDFVYVQDVADALLKVSLCHDYPEILNVGSGESVRVLDIVKKVADHFCIKECWGESVDVDGINFYSDSEEMLSDYGWSSKVGIEDGIKECIEVYKCI